MPALIPDCVKSVDNDGDRVILKNPKNGLEVKMNAWEARLLPFLDTGPDAKTIARNASAIGVSMPIDHVEALLKRLGLAGLLIAPPRAAALPPDPPKAPSPPSAAKEPEDPQEAERLRVELAYSAFQEEASDFNQLADAVAKYADKGSGSATLRAEPRTAQTPTQAPPPEPTALPGPVPAPVPRPIPAITRPRARPALAHSPTAVTQVHRRVEEEPPPLPPAPRRSGRLVFVLLATAAAITALGFVPWPYGIVAPCVLDPIVRQPVRLPVGVVIRSVYVEDGQAVKAGEVVSLVDAERLKLDQQQTQLAIDVISGELQAMSKVGRPEVSKMRQLVEVRTSQMRVAHLDFRRVEALAQINQATAAETEKATGAISVAKDALIQAQAELADAISHTPEDLHLKQAELDRLRVTLVRQQELANQPEIRSPIDGTIAALRVRDGRAGEAFKAGTDLMEIVQLERLRAGAWLPQRHLEKVQVGSPVRISVTGVLQSYPSRLQLVGSTIEGEASARYVRLVALVDNPQGLLRQNAECLLEVEAERDSILRTVALRAGAWLDRARSRQ